MLIPKRFKLLGKTISIVFDPELHHKDEKHGWASYRRDEIVLQPKCQGVDFTQSNVEQTFVHEMVHHICYYAGNVIQQQLGKEYLHQNEAFVDLFAALLHQVLTTFDFGESSVEESDSK